MNAFAIVLLTLLGAAGESLGMDRHLKVNIAKHRTHSLFRQGCMLYELIPNMPELRLRPLVARLEGKGTVDKKISLITELLTSASPIEALYLTRTLIGDLRIGIQESTIRDAIALAFFNNEEGMAKHIQNIMDRTNDIGTVFEIIKKGGINDLEGVQLDVGKPVKVMLAQKAKTVKSASFSNRVCCPRQWFDTPERVVSPLADNNN